MCVYISLLRANRVSLLLFFSIASREHARLSPSFVLSFSRARSRAASTASVKHERFHPRKSAYVFFSSAPSSLPKRPNGSSIRQSFSEVPRNIISVAHIYIVIIQFLSDNFTIIPTFYRYCLTFLINADQIFPPHPPNAIARKFCNNNYKLFDKILHIRLATTIDYVNPQ